MRRFVLVLSACLAVAATAVAGFSFAGVVSPEKKAAVQVTDIQVRALEGFRFEFSSLTAPAGIVNFHLINVDSTSHDLAIGGQKTPIISGGQTADLSINMTAGTYPFACTIGEHAEFGMRGNFTVTGTTQTTTSVITTGGSTITSVITSTQPTTALPPPSQTIRVSEKEFKIIMPTTPKRVTYFVKVKGKRVRRTKIVAVQKPAKAVRTRFIVKNVGKIGHNFVIGGIQTPILKSGQSASIIVTLKKGKMAFLCSVAGHPALGMKGKLVVI
jgi:uncharacterized cupredoxin-like copper-binding protein